VTEPGARWRAELGALIARGVDEAGREAVLAALSDEAEVIAAEPAVDQWDAVAPVLGVSGCASGWVGVLLVPGTRPATQVAGTLTSLVDHVRHEVALAVLAIGRTPGGRYADACDTDALAWCRSGAEISCIEVRTEASLAALTRTGIATPAWFRGSGFTEAELKAACAAAWTGARHVRGQAEPVADTPLVAGLPVLV